MLHFIQRLWWRFRNRKLLRELRRCRETQIWMETHPREEVNYMDYLRECFER